MITRLVSFTVALVVISGAGQICLANDPQTRQKIGQARILELPNGEARVHLEQDSSGEVGLDPNRYLALSRRGNRVFASVHDRTTNQTDQLFDREVTTLPHRTVEARLADVNFDGTRDLLIETQIGYGGVNVFFDLYLGNEAGFESRTASRALSNPEIDPEQKQITTMQRSGPTWQRSVYLISNLRPYHFMTSTAAGDGMEYARFLTDDGKLDQEMITDALAKDPKDWKPLRIELPKGALFPLRGEPVEASASSSALPDGSTIFIRRLSDDHKFVLVEHSKGKIKGWLKTEWLPTPDGIRF